jgi:type IV pilus assembly protein PilV
MSIIKKGFTLLEVLIALVILAVGILGIATLLLVSGKANNSSYIKQQAEQAINDILDKMRANWKVAASGNYNINNIVNAGAPTIPSAPAVNCDAAACTPPQLASYDSWYWLAKTLVKLPSGCGSITTAVSGAANNTLVTITVQWDDSPAQNKLGAVGKTSVANPALAQITMQSEL